LKFLFIFVGYRLKNIATFCQNIRWDNIRWSFLFQKLKESFSAFQNFPVAETFYSAPGAGIDDITGL